LRITLKQISFAVVFTLVGFGIGQTEKSVEFADKILSIFTTLADKYGVSVAFAFFGFAFLAFVAWYGFGSAIKTYQREIDRMAKEKDKLQQLILEDWKSSRDCKFDIKK